MPDKKYSLQYSFEFQLLEACCFVLFSRFSVQQNTIDNALLHYYVFNIFYKYFSKNIKFKAKKNGKGAKKKYHSFTFNNEY